MNEKVIEVKGNHNKKYTHFNKRKINLKILKEQKYLLIMSLPFVIWLVIFRYLPLWGWTMAFQDYKPALNFFQQKWVGFKYFIQLFSDQTFYQALRNTIAMSLLGLIFGFVMPVIFALLLNEIRNIKFKRLTQTISYLPHFVSWVVVASIVTLTLSPAGSVDSFLVKYGLVKQPIGFLTKPTWFWMIIVITNIWKETGWNAIIYLAAITGIDPELYEAAKVDGAGRLRLIWHITLPGIMPTMIILLIMSIGSLINIGFEQQFLIGNPIVKDYAYVIDWYALDYGIGLFRYSFGTAIGIFKSVVSIILLFIANSIAKKVSDTSIL
ncbi:ABC transporter permease [Thermoanaerobacterium thermosaccharolyticum]|uniref:ABC transporter permease n=1 Tax=Thermoanaerobacterium thermosaccharolyticum TaxID=1517 RepID=UPI002683192C